MGASEDTLALVVFLLRGRFCFASPAPGVATDRRAVSWSTNFSKFRPDPSRGKPIRGENIDGVGQSMYPFPELPSGLDAWLRQYMGPGNVASGATKSSTKIQLAACFLRVLILLSFSPGSAPRQKNIDKTKHG